MPTEPEPEPDYHGVMFCSTCGTGVHTVNNDGEWAHLDAKIDLLHPVSAPRPSPG